MPMGDIEINSFNIGGYEFVNSQRAMVVDFVVRESMFNHLGPSFSCKILDSTVLIGDTNFNGNEKVNISWSVPSPVVYEDANFSFMTTNNQELNDGSKETAGSLHSKTYQISGESPEYLNAAANRVNKSWNTPVHNMVSDIVKNNFKSIKNVDTPDATRSRNMIIRREDCTSAISKLNAVAVSTQNKSSFYTLYQTRDGGRQKYVYETFENAFKRNSGMTFWQDATVGTKYPSDSVTYPNIIWFKPSEMFFTPSRVLNTGVATSYNTENGKALSDYSKRDDTFTIAGTPIPVPQIFQDASNFARFWTRNLNNPSNQKQPTDLASAKSNRMSFFSHFIQNYADFEVSGNPNIKVGSVVNLIVPNKSITNQGSDEEKQFNGPALVVSVTHKIRALGQQPRYTCIVRVVKGGFDQ